MTSFLYGAVTTCVILLSLFLAPVSVLEDFLMSPKVFPTILDVRSTHDGAVFITGCSSGIGRAAGLKLAVEEKFHVFCTVRKEQDAIELQKEYETQRRQQQQGDSGDDDNTLYLHTLLVDVSKRDQIYDAKSKIENWIKGSEQDPSMKPRVLVGIVNNAGITGALEPIEFVDVEDGLNWVMSVNVEAHIHSYQAFLPLLRLNENGGGRVVNVGSVAGQAARPFRGAYTISKFALEGLSDTMRQEVLHENISVSMVNPGFIKTNIFQAANDQTNAKYKTEDDLNHLSTIHQSMLQSYKQSTDEIAQHRAGSTDETNRDIYDALTSPTPRSRYYPGTVGIGSLPAWLWPKIRMLLPDRAADGIILKKLLSMQPKTITKTSD